ncbi:peptidoglycan-binding domain-containing protein [Streptomyces cyanogenus]|uniref:Zinc D-Ala-D-Ala carboxypeptidase n=1 Tax=Streptomyces cyanogenus TaxID=80860 RepID=A0ABX7U1S4_STRCY|nr:peptidoglycan-binding domain-containing protein [Streptomyces cyanogenus]QTE02985.1 Zinc D-Ala-D-Ala carboxypeptidase precursor [Streptomyces cyanogenus]
MSKTLRRRAGLAVSALALGSAAVTAGPAVASPASVPAAPASESACSYDGAHPYLYPGDPGKAVAHAQCLLNLYGRRLQVDGQFGPATKAAVIWAQGRCHIDTDGIVGPKTWDCLHPDKSPNP